MTNLYLYERKQRRTAVILLLNMAVLLIMYFAARQLIEPSDAAEQFFAWLDLGVPVVAISLLLLAIFFWFQNGTFRIAVDAHRFEISDPISEQVSFSVPVNEIVEISQVYRMHLNNDTILMHMKSGENIQVLQNHRYDRGKLYAALAKANPAIRLPEQSVWAKQDGDQKAS